MGGITNKIQENIRHRKPTKRIPKCCCYKFDNVCKSFLSLQWKARLRSLESVQGNTSGKKKRLEDRGAHEVKRKKRENRDERLQVLNVLVWFSTTIETSEDGLHAGGDNLESVQGSATCDLWASCGGARRWRFFCEVHGKGFVRLARYHLLSLDGYGGLRKLIRFFLFILHLLDLGNELIG